jgi:hypothetical protein
VDAELSAGGVSAPADGDALEAILVDGRETPHLAAFFTLYRLLRAEAGLRVYEYDSPVFGQLAELREEYRDDLRRKCGSDEALFSRLCRAKDAIVNVDVDRNDPDKNDYMELFRHAMSLEDRR